MNDCPSPTGADSEAYARLLEELTPELYGKLTPFERRVTTRSFRSYASAIYQGRSSRHAPKNNYQAARRAYGGANVAQILTVGYPIGFVGGALVSLADGRIALLVPGIGLILFFVAWAIFFQRRAFQISRYFRDHPSEGGSVYERPK